MKNIKRLILPLTIFAGLTLASCRADLATNYSKDDQNIDTDWVDFNIPPTGITFAQGEDNLFVERGETHQYQYTVTPKGASAALLNWSSADENIATVSDTGLVTAVAGGHTQITVREENGAFAPVFLNVNVTVELTAFNVSLDSLELDWNHEYTFTQTFTPSDTTWTDLVWTIPEEEQNIATIEDGVLTTYHTNGTVHLTVTSPRLSDVHQDFELHVADRKIHVNTIALALDDGAANRIEIGKNTQVVATIDPANAEDAATLKYYSRDPEIAIVDADTGVITGVEPGVAHIFANCEGVDSNDLEVTIYEVYATSIAFAEESDVIVTNEEDGSKQLHVNIGVSEMGATAPSRATPTYSVKYEDRDIVSVSETGVVSALKSGTATVNVSIAGEGSTTHSDSIQVTSKAYVNRITITGPISAYLDETATLVATVSPDAVEDEIITWSVNPAEKVTTQINDNEIILTPLDEGPVTVTATSDRLGVTASHTVSFNERKVEFESGEVYLVGDKQFNTGESIVGVASWTNAKYALKLGPSSSDDPNVSRQVKATVTLHAGDQFKLREGPLDTGWKDLFYYGDDGAKVWNYEQAGAIDGTHLRAGSSPSGNIEVLRDGKYDIYYKDLVSGGFNIYIGFAPVIHFDKTSLSIGLNSTTNIYLHNYEGEVSVISSDASIVKVLGTTATTSSGLCVELSGLAVGSATITATDSENNVATAHVTVRSDSGGVMTPIYLNANGIFDNDGAVPFVHAFGDPTNHQDTQMTLVAGQSMIYSAEISGDYENVIFVRMPNGSTALDWETAWNQTKDEDAAYGDHNMFTITGYDEGFLTGTWGTFDPEVVYTLPADYCLVGTFNNWTVGDQNYGMTKVESGHYRLTNVDLEQGDAVKVVDKTGTHWFANANTYDNCGYTLVDDGYGGKNMSLNETATYTIDFYEVDVYGTDNHIVFTKQGDDPIDPPTPTNAYFLKGTFNSWSEDEAYQLTVDPENANHYVLAEVELTAEEELKVNNPSQGDNGWYTNDHTYDGCGFTLSDDGNIVVSETGTYKVDFYVSSDDGNHITLTKQGDDPVVVTEYYLKGTFNEWAEQDAYKFVADANNANHYVLAEVELTAEDEMKVNNPALGDEGWYTNDHTYENCGFSLSVDGNIIISETGTYKVDFYVSSDDGNHIVFTKQGDDPIDPPTPTNAYFLKGTFNEWAESDSYRFTVDENDSNHYTLEGVELTATDQLKVNNPALGDNGWYTNDHTYDGCGFTLSNDGNIVVSETGTYNISFYVSSDDGNHVVLAKQSGGGDDPVVTVNYYLKGTFNEWGQSDAYKFVADANDANHYVLAEVELTANDEMKVNNPALGDNGWYSNNHTYNNCGFTISEGGNVVVSQSGTYKVDFYVNSDDGNHIVLTKQGTDPVDPPEPSTIKTFYFSDNYHWDNVKAYVWNNASGAKPADWPGVAMTYVYTNDMGEAVYSITVDTSLYDYIIFNSGSVQTVNIALSSFGSNNACYISGGSGNSHTVAYWNYQA